LDEGLNINNETESNGGLSHGLGLGLELPPFMTTPPVDDPLSLTSTPTEEATPTTESLKLEAEAEPGTSSNFLPPSLPSSPSMPSKRRVRLESVRSRFCELYQRSIITPPCRKAHENGSAGGGIGYLIGNIASKVGIRSASHRTTQL